MKMGTVDSTSAVAEVGIELGVAFDLRWGFVRGKMDVLRIKLAHKPIEN